MLVYIPPKTKLTIHSDKPKDTTDPGKLDQAVFLPLKSCEETTWSWYEVTDPTKIFYHGENGAWQTVPMIRPIYAKQIDSVKCDGPLITDIGTWHSLNNMGTEPAIGLSLRLMPWSWKDFSTSQELFPIKNIKLL